MTEPATLDGRVLTPKFGEFADIYHQFDPDTIQHAHQIHLLRQTFLGL